MLISHSGTLAIVLATLMGVSVASEMRSPPRGPLVTASRQRALAPRDQSDEDVEFALWKRHLLAAAERGDLAVLREALAPVVRIGGEDGSREQAIAGLELREGRPWRALRDALRLGVTREEGRFVAPYVFGARSALDANEGVITASKVNLRSSPNSDAAVVAVLSYDIVHHDESHPYHSDLFEQDDQPVGAEAWAKVVTGRGATGFVYGRYFRSPLDKRFIFERLDGRWRITSISAGD